MPIFREGEEQASLCSTVVLLVVQGVARRGAVRHPDLGALLDEARESAQASKSVGKAGVESG